MNLTWPLALVIAASLFTLVALVWIDKKYRTKEQKRFPNIWMITLIGGVFLSLCIFVMEAIDLLPEGWSKEYWFVFPLIFIALWASVAIYIKRLKAPDINKHKAKIIERLRAEDNAVLYRGSGFRGPWLRHKVVESDDESKIYNKVRHFLVLAESTTIKMYLITQDLFTLEPTEWNAYPNKEQIDKAFGKGVSASPDIERAMAIQGFVADSPNGESYEDTEENQ